MMIPSIITTRMRMTGTRWKNKVIGIVLLVAALLLLGSGILLGGPFDVWSKAIRICMECIGIG